MTVEKFTKSLNMSVQELFFTAWRTMEGREPNLGEVSAIRQDVRIYNVRKIVPGYVIWYMND